MLMWRQWPSERKEQAVNMSEKGYSFLDIAKRLTREGFPVTRSAVAGQLHRLGVRPPRIKPEIKREPTNDAFTAVQKLTSWTCRFPEGDPTSNNFTFCMGLVRPGQVYCPKHCEIAYTPARR